uniref:Uncharacterized protein n=1 Tax=Alexandrium monilatum TaxID=311494 RepID=A0A7S4RVS8_9DINO
MASGRAHSRSAPVAAASCLLAASAPLFASTSSGVARQPVARPLAASAVADGGLAPEAAASLNTAGLVAFGGVIGAAGAALAGRPRGAAARHSSRCGVARAAEGEAPAKPEPPAEKAEPPAATPPTPAAEEKAAEKAEPATPAAPPAPPAPAAEKAPEPPAPAAPAPAEEKKAPEPPAPAAPAPAKEEKAPEPPAAPTPAAPPAAEEKAPEPSAPSFIWSKQLGVTEPMGFWDPAGFSTGKGEATFVEYRTAELKHGRVAMLAALGAVFQHFITFPGFDDVPRGLGAPFTVIGGLGFVGLLGFSYVLETDVWKQDPEKEIGDFGDPLNLNQYTEEMRNKELNNGRFAMIAAMGIILAENETGKDAVEQIFGI